jgi:hypothetical protein
LAAAFLASSAPAQPNVYGSTPAPSERDDARAPAPAQSFPSAPNLPDLGDSSQTEITPQIERRIGESIMREIRRDPAYVDDPEIRDYVQSIGYRLVAASGETRQEFEFFVVRDRTVNAFAMPGGFIGVHTGLLLAAQTESEFASVMGHEIAHVLQRHMARQYDAQSKVSKMSLLAMALALLAARSNPQVAQAAIVAGRPRRRSTSTTAASSARRTASATSCSTEPASTPPACRGSSSACRRRPVSTRTTRRRTSARTRSPPSALPTCRIGRRERRTGSGPTASSSSSSARRCAPPTARRPKR